MAVKKPVAKKPVKKKPVKKPVAKKPAKKAVAKKKPAAKKLLKKVAAKKKPAKKAVAKKAVAKKAVAKKAAAKKPVARKPTVKRAAVKVVAPPSPRDVALKAKTVSELKAMLHKNDQVVTGTRQELVDRVVDRVEHGNLPRCPQCYLGRLRERADGSYYCPGGYDDDEYKECNFTSPAGSIERPPWQFETPGVV